MEELKTMAFADLNNEVENDIDEEGNTGTGGVYNRTTTITTPAAPLGDHARHLLETKPEQTALVPAQSTQLTPAQGEKLRQALHHRPNVSLDAHDGLPWNTRGPRVGAFVVLA